MAAKAPPPPDFEKSLEELEGLVEQLEKGELSLEEALRRFERGIVLARSCQSALQAVEQKVEQLLAENGQLRTAPFDAQE
ncbi:MAG: exodeoxyribonuclease VII small subunit [Pseudomonadota bacterium]|nr:exodeoxyribonuclease VII small subunit [Pseudomonadota bacterium]